MAVLHFGVVDLPYGDTASGNAPKKGAETTGDVAEILEAKYHVIELFYQELGDHVASALELSAARAIQSCSRFEPASSCMVGWLQRNSLAL